MRYLITFSYDGSKYGGYQKQLDILLEKDIETIKNFPEDVKKTMEEVTFEKSFDVYNFLKCLTGTYQSFSSFLYDVSEREYRYLYLSFEYWNLRHKKLSFNNTKPLLLISVIYKLYRKFFYEKTLYSLFLIILVLIILS